MYLLIVVLPLLSALGAGFFGRQIGERGAVILTTTCLGVTALMSLMAFLSVGIEGNPVQFKLGTWMDSENFIVHWGFLFDSLTVTMLVVVTVVSSLVHLYSGEQMNGDPHRPRFMSYLSLFTFFMLILVTADNYLQMFIGWEGVGLCSQLLINFWQTRIQANKAAIQAMLVNRVGDFGLALGMMAIYQEFQSLDQATVFATAPTALGNQVSFMNVSVNSLTLITLLVFVGAVGKSAQVGLHTWLPNAMEGPTPVSALIHAATMVTAGVFLLARSSPLFEQAPFSLSIVTIMGAMTAFFAATTGLLQNDLKKVIAQSTCSQLGQMVFACGLSAQSVGVFHLANHAFFKALLFLSAGSVIHAMGDEQDLRRMGGLRNLLPFTQAMIFIGSLALMGFPFLTGFQSKDVILELAQASQTMPGHFAHWLGTLAAFFTAFQSMRLLHLTFLSDPAGHKKHFEGAHDAPWAMGLPLLVLSFGSIFVGQLTKDLIIGVGTDFWNNALFTHPKHLTLLEAEFIPHSIKLIPVIFSLVGATSAFFLQTFFGESLFQWKTNNSLGRNLQTFLNRKWFFDKVQTESLTQASLHHGQHSTQKMVDRGLIELLGPQGISQRLQANAYTLSNFQTGHLQHQTLMMILGLSIPLFFFQTLSSGLSFWAFSALQFKVLILFFLIVFFGLLRIHSMTSFSFFSEGGFFLLKEDAFFIRSPMFLELEPKEDQRNPLKN